METPKNANLTTGQCKIKIKLHILAVDILILSLSPKYCVATLQTSVNTKQYKVKNRHPPIPTMTCRMLRPAAAAFSDPLLVGTWAQPTAGFSLTCKAISPS